MKKGFTLVELVIVIVIVGILSIVAVPIYRGYVEKARLTEGKALASAIRTAQMIYYAEHGSYYSVAAITDYDPVLQIDARGNKYFKQFTSLASAHTGAWVATVRDVSDSNVYLDFYWNMDNSLPVNIDGHQLPAFRLMDGESSWTNS